MELTSGWKQCLYCIILEETEIQSGEYDMELDALHWIDRTPLQYFLLSYTSKQPFVCAPAAIEEHFIWKFTVIKYGV